MIEDISGKPMNAMKVVAMSIEYLKNHMMKLIDTRVKGINVSDVHFVLTIPAIWDDSAKQFMTEAADKVFSMGCTYK